MTKTQVDKLGDRLKEGKTTEEDLRMIDVYRRSFGDAYDEVVGSIRGKLGLDPTGRPTKSTTSIIEKLRREHIRLSQMQDIAGCRLIVDSIEEQDAIVESLKQLFVKIKVIDRRERPSHGYRAVHLIVTARAKDVEIQLRTLLQHQWAELSEKAADVLDPEIKYGGGKREIREHLSKLSHAGAEMEQLEKEVSKSLRMLIDTQNLIAEKEEAIRIAHVQQESNQENNQKLLHSLSKASAAIESLTKTLENLRQRRNDFKKKLIHQYKEMSTAIEKMRDEQSGRII